MLLAFSPNAPAPPGRHRHRSGHADAHGRAGPSTLVGALLVAVLGSACAGDADELFGPGFDGCTPGQSRSCYDGPVDTLDVGPCRAGQQTCNEQGTAFGPCEHQVVPGEEDCRTPVDESCDGLTPPCPPGYPVVDLRADADRDGVVELDDPDEDRDEDRWEADHGAIFLANIDDDEQVCPVVEDDDELAGCHDAADERVNGPLDALDLARLRTVPWPAAPEDASGTIAVTPSAAAARTRLFERTADRFVPYRPGDELSAAKLRAGVELAIEGLDIVRSEAAWDGFVELTLFVDGGTGPDGPWPDAADTVRMRVAPVLFRHHLSPAQAVYVAQVEGFPGSDAFVADVEQAVSEAQVPGGLTRFTDYADQWTQDYFETAYTAMPSEQGQHVIHVNFRSPNYRGSQPRLRQAGRIVFTELRGPNVAGVAQYDPDHPDAMDSLNSFGNLEAIPPHVHQGVAWPAGRVLIGSSPSHYPDRSFVELVSSQQEQAPVTIDTQWLLVGHVDETVHFVPAATPRGFVMLAADPTLARSMLEAECDVDAPATTPGCSVEMFVDKWWSLTEPATVTIEQVLNDPDVMNESAWAASAIGEQLTTLREAIGLGDDEIVPVPVLFHPVDGKAVAYQPNTVNGFVLDDRHFATAATHGPRIGGVDPFAAQLEAALGAFGITVHWVEDWRYYHRYHGDVHCGLNATRQVPAEAWWEATP